MICVQLQYIHLLNKTFTILFEFTGAKKEQPLQNEISNVRMQIAALENLHGRNDKRELQTAVTSLEEVLQRVSTTLGVKGQFKCALKFSSPTKNNGNT